MRTPRRRILVRAGLGLFAVAVLLQLVPYGRDHTNPPVTQDPPWARETARGPAPPAVYARHSNQPRWPPQSYVAPFSWMVTRDVEQGREALNFSTWFSAGDTDDDEADDAAGVVADAEMPPRRYLVVHPDAALSDAERQVLVEALEARDRARGGDRSGPGGGGQGQGSAAGAEAGQEGLELVAGAGPAVGRGLEQDGVA